MKRTSATILATASFLSLATQAVTIAPLNNPQTDENILFNEPGLLQSGNTVQGISNNTDFVVNFTSDESLTTPSGGQARVAGPFDDLLISLADPTASFSSIIFNLDSDADGSVTFNVDYILAGSVYSDTFTVSANGQNFFTITADGTERLTSVEILGIGEVDFTDINQVRIGGLGTTTSVPDGGATVALLGLGVAGLAFARRKLA